MRLVERDDGLTTLQELLDDGGAGRGGTAIIAGPPGSGKSELLHRFAECAAAKGFTILTATGSKAERTLPLGMLSQLFHSTPPGQHGAGHIEALNAEVADTELEPSVQKLHRLFLAVNELARRNPVALCIDDLQHIDRSSLQWLLYLARRIKAAPVVIAGTECDLLSPTDPDLRTELLSQSHTRRIHLSLLSPGGVAQTLGGSTGAVSDRAAFEYLRLTGGNPTLLHGLAADQPHPQAVPLHAVDGFSNAVASCLYGLEAPVLQVARSIAVLGEQVSTTLLSQLTGLPVPSVVQAVDLLTRTGLLDSDARLRHSRAVSAVLDGMSSEERSDLHRRTARLLNQSGVAAPDVADHLVASAPVQDQWAVPVLREAADRSVADGMFAQALDYLNLAHRMTSDEAQRASLKTALVRVEWRVSPASALLHLTELIPAAKHQVPTADAIVLPRYLAWYGRTVEAGRLLNSLDDRGDELGHEATAELLLSKSIIACLHPGWIPALRTGGDEQDTVVRPGTPTVGADLGVRAGDILIAALRGDPDGSVVVDAEQILQQTHVNDSSAAAMAAAVTALLYTERVDHAVPWSTSLAAHPGDRSPTWRALCTALRAEIALRTGNLKTAERLAAGALDEMPLHDWGLAIGAPLSTLVSARTLMGRPRDCERYVRMPLPKNIFDTLFGLHFLEARGRHHLASGRPHAALGDFLACGNLMRGWNVDRPGVVAWRLRAAQTHLHMGNAVEARALIEEQLGMLTANETRTRGQSLTLLAAAIDLRGRPAKLRQAVELLRAQGDRLSTAHALADLSHSYHALGDSAKARTTVRRARQLADECGAVRLSEKLLPGPAQSYVEPHHAATIGDAPATSLSEAERRVASLAAYGYTNREISSKLFITVSTVEQHLTRIYRKLDVNSRADLSERLLNSSEAFWDETAKGA